MSQFIALLKYSTKSTCYFYSNFDSEILYNILLNIIEVWNQKTSDCFTYYVCYIENTLHRNGVKTLFPS